MGKSYINKDTGLGILSTVYRFSPIRFSISGRQQHVYCIWDRCLWNSRENALKVADLFTEDNPDLNNDIGFTTSLRTTTALDSSISKGLGGSYFNPDRAALRRVSFDDGNLHFEGSKLRPINEMRFYFDEEPGVEEEFSTDKKGKPANVTTYTSTGENSYHIVEVEIPSADVLKGYQGMLGLR